MRFGTDGIRFTVDAANLPYNLVRLGSAVGRIFRDKGLKNCAVSSDTRESKDLVKSAIVAGLLSESINVTDCGVIPSGLFALLVKAKEFDFGLVITASHNPPEHNGVKIVDSMGRKSSPQLETEVETMFEDYKNTGLSQPGKLSYLDGRSWCQHFLNSLWPKIAFNDLRVVLDFGHGATAWIGDAPFRSRGAQTLCIGQSLDGAKINTTGCMNPDTCISVCRDNHYDVGFCFDGDGDRMLVCSPTGQLINGDGLLAILVNHAPHVLDKPITGVVGTVLSNSGLETLLKSKNIRFHRSQVGDKNVVNDMIKLNFELGGEPSGHIFLEELDYSGDGLVNAMLVCAIMAATNKSIMELLEGYYPVPQKIFNHVLLERKSLLEDNALSSIIQDLESKGVKVLIRYSGTEPVVRILIESSKVDLIDYAHQEIVKLLKSLGVISQ